MPRPFALACALVLASASEASAGPVIAAVGALAASVSAGVAVLGATALGSAALQLGASLALSAIGRALTGRPSRSGQQAAASAGVRRTVEIGGDKTQPVILGYYATAGHLVWAGSHRDNADGSPHGWYVEVILLSVLPGLVLRRIAVNGRWVTLGGPNPTYGPQVNEFITEKGAYLFVEFYGSGLGAAQPTLSAKYGGRPDWPWLADMVGRGVAFAVVYSRWHDELHRGQPARVLFEVSGIPLYERRLDTTAGGAGSQRRDDRSTWTFSDNPIAAIDTIMGPGLGYGAEHLYGPRLPAAAMPASSWFAASNATDQPMPLAGGGTERAYRFGAEIDLATEPADVVAELLKSCAGDIAVCEGRVLVRVGPSGGADMAFSDDDCSIEEAQSLDPFRSAASVYNGATATFPDPGLTWTTSPAPPRYNPAFEAEDGGRRQMASLSYPYVPHIGQVQRLMVSALADERRQRTHQVVLPPVFGRLEPLDTVAWTSVRNGYVAKLFKVVEVVDQPSGWVALTLLEEDPGDYDWTAAQELPHVQDPILLPILEQLSVPGFQAQPLIIADAAGRARRPAIRLLWLAAGLDAVPGIRWELRLVGATGLPASGLEDAAAGSVEIAAGIIPSAEYEARATPVAPGQVVAWTPWLPVTAPAVLLSGVDLTVDFLDEQRAEAEAAVDVLRQEAIAAFGPLDMFPSLAATTAERFGSFDTRVDEVEGTVTAQATDIAGVTAALEGKAAASALSALTTRVTETEGDVTALASSYDELEVVVGGTTASIATLEATRVDAAGAIAAVEEAISAEYGSVLALAEATAFAQSTADDVRAGYLWRARAGGAVGEIEVVAADDPVTGPASLVRLRADRFIFEGNLAMFANNVAIVGTLNVAGEAITATRTFEAVSGPPAFYQESYQPVVFWSVTLPRAGVYLFMFETDVAGAYPSNANLLIEMYIAGVGKISGRQASGEATPTANTLSRALFLNAGTWQVQIYARTINWGFASGIRGLPLQRLFVFGASR